MTDIKIYTTPSCPYCHKLKDWLEEKNYEFEDFNVGDDKEAAKEMIERTSQKGLPQTFIGDKEIIGFRPDKIEEAIEQA